MENVSIQFSKSTTNFTSSKNEAVSATIENGSRRQTTNSERISSERSMKLLESLGKRFSTALQASSSDFSNTFQKHVASLSSKGEQREFPRPLLIALSDILNSEESNHNSGGSLEFLQASERLTPSHDIENLAGCSGSPLTPHYVQSNAANYKRKRRLETRSLPVSPIKYFPSTRQLYPSDSVSHVASKSFSILFRGKF